MKAFLFSIPKLVPTPFHYRHSYFRDLPTTYAAAPSKTHNIFLSRYIKVENSTMATSSTKTVPLYQKDGTLHTHATTISAISPLAALPPETQSLFKATESSSEEPYIITTPETIFHAQGGGQPSDTGTMTLATNESQNPVFTVQSVRASPPAILHYGTFSSAHRFPLNAPVTQNVDPGPRLLHSRLHTGGHALGLAVMSLLKSSPGLLPSDLKEGKASHAPGTASVEFLGAIPGAAKQAIQDAVDALVGRDLPVSIHFVDEREAVGRCGVVAEGVKGGEDGVRLVEIEGAGAYPCGGTHVGRLKEVGRVLVKGIKRQKGVSKVSYDVVDV